MTTAGPQLPHLEVFERVLTLPVVERALSKSAATYTRVKDSHQLLHWVLTTAETSLSHATKQAVVPIAAPIARKLESPIHYVDHTLCMGLDKIEEKVPLVKEKPEQILENAYDLAFRTVQPAVLGIALVNAMILSQATSLRDMSWNKANQILDTHYGSVAIKGLDSTAVVVDKLIDKYFPPTGEEQPVLENTDEHDKLLHTLQTVGRLSNKAARRVYTNVVLHMRTINRDNLKAYVGSLVEFLQITRYLYTVNDKTDTQPKAKKSKKSQSKAEPKTQPKAEPKTQPKADANNKKADENNKKMDENNKKMDENNKKKDENNKKEN